MHPPHTPIRTTEDLAATWRFIDGGGGYSAPQMFVLMIDADGTLGPTIVQIYDSETGGEPADDLLAALMERLAEALDMFAPGGSIAVMKARPGLPTLTRLDHRWLRGLHRHLRTASFSSHPLFFASDAGVAQVPPDALLGATA